MISRSEGDIDDSLIGGNASADIQDEGCDTTTVTGVDIILNHKLQETSYDKKSYTNYIKDYMKAWVFYTPPSAVFYRATRFTRNKRSGVIYRVELGWKEQERAF